MRTVRHKVFQFIELGNKEKERAQKAIDSLAAEGYLQEFGNGYKETYPSQQPSLQEWQIQHYDINQFEFTQTGNIFFK